MIGFNKQDIDQLIYVVIDMTTNKIVGVKLYLAKPIKVDEKENMLSDQVSSIIGY